MYASPKLMVVSTEPNALRRTTVWRAGDAYVYGGVFRPASLRSQHGTSSVVPSSERVGNPSVFTPASSVHAGLPGEDVNGSTCCGYMAVAGCDKLPT